MNRESDGVMDLALQVLRDSGATSAEVYLEDYAVTSVSVAGGRIENLESQEVRGAGVRVFRDGRVGFCYTTALGPEGLKGAAQTALSLLAFSDADEANRLPEADAAAPGLAEPDIFDLMIARVDQQEKISVARRVEDAARATDPRVTKVRRSKYTDVAGRVEVAGTGGLRRSWPFSRVYAAIELTAEEKGELQSGYYADFSVRFSGLDPVQVGREAARRAVQKLGASRTATRRTNVVLEPSVAASLLEAIAPVFHADNVLKGKSLLASRTGQVVAGPRVTLLDDGRLPGADHTAPYDAEGLATRTTSVIEAGTLKGFLHSSYTAATMRAPVTGNAFRSSFKMPPRISPSNLFLQPTGIGRDALLSEAGSGIYVTEVMGLHTIDPISGDYSLGASGLMLRDGRLEGPVDRIVIAGNVLDLLRCISAVAVDLRLMPGGGAGSTTLLADVSVSGT